MLGYLGFELAGESGGQAGHPWVVEMARTGEVDGELRLDPSG
jgi:hypothetical protein